MDAKKCNRCLMIKPLIKFNKHPSTADRRQNQCRDCRNEIQVEYRKERGGNIKTIVYEKTKKGFLVRCYRNMLSRTNGVQKKKYHLYKGLSLLDKDHFYTWSLLNQDFHTLFTNWERNNYDRKLTPSIDRIDSKKGYEFGNIRWITFSENSLLGTLSRHKIKT